MADDRKRAGGEKIKFDPEMIAATAAVVIGVCALVISLYEVRIMRNQERASTWPYVVIATANAPDDPEVSLLLLNQGSGPAIKQGASVSYQGRYFKNWRDVAAAADLEEDIDYVTNGLLAYALLPAGEIQRVFSVPNEEKYRPLHRLIPNLKIKLCYCSMLGECWVTETPGEIDISDAIEVTEYLPKEAVCDIPEERRFLN